MKSISANTNIFNTVYIVQLKRICVTVYVIFFSCYNLKTSPPCGLVFNGQKDPISQEFGFIRLNQTSRLNLVVPQMRLFWDELNFPEKCFLCLQGVAFPGEEQDIWLSWRWKEKQIQQFCWFRNISRFTEKSIKQYYLKDKFYFFK